MVLRRTLSPEAESQIAQKQQLQRRVDDAMRGRDADVDQLLELAMEVLESDMLSPSERETFIRVLEAETGLDLRRQFVGGARRADPQALAREIALDARGPVQDGPGSGVLRAISDGLGLSEKVDRQGPVVSAPTAEIAENVEGLVEKYGSELGVETDDLDVVVSQGGPGKGRLGLMKDGAIELDASRVDTEKPEGRAVVAHELAHVAQLESRQATIANDARRIDKAEFEADAVFKAAMNDDVLPTPTARLVAEDEAACGPMEMNQKKGGGGGGGGDDPDPITEVVEITEPPEITLPPDEPDPPPGGGEDCLECPEPDLEHQTVQPLQQFAPREAQPGQRELDLSIAGRRLRVLLPETAAPGEIRVELQDRDSPFTALKLRRAVLRLDENLNVESGEIQAGVELGNYVKVDNVVLQVDREGRVDVHIRNCEIQVNEDIRARVDLVIGPDGFHGAATVTAEAIALGPMYTIKDALLHVRIDANGSVSAHGDITFEVNGLFGVRLEACYVDGEWRGRLTFIWEKDIELFDGVILTQATITGCFSKDYWWIEGTATLDVIDHFEVRASIKYEWKEGDSWWYFRGEVEQHTPIPVIEGVTLEDVYAYIEWSKDHWEPATLEAWLIHEYFEGDLYVEWDIEEGLVNGEAGVTLTQPYPLNEAGARIEEAHARIYVEDNELTVLEGEIIAILPLEGEDTFEIAATGLSYDFQENKFNGQLDLTLLRDLQFGDPEAGLSALMHEGAFVHASVVDNKFGGMEAGLDFEVYNSGNQIGFGGLTFEMDGEYAFDGLAYFELIDRWGIPDQEEGPVFLLEGGYFEVAVSSDGLNHALAENVRFEILQTDGEGRIEGEVHGDFDFNTGLGNFEGTARVAAAWPMAEEAWGSVILEEGGKIDIGITESVLTKCEGFIPFLVDISADSSPYLEEGFAVRGIVEGAYDPATQKVNGSLSARLLDPIVINVPETNGHQIIILPNTQIAATVTESEPDEFLMQLFVEYHDEEGPLLAGEVTDARYSFKTGEFGFDGLLVLKREIKTDLSADSQWSIAAVPEVTNFEISVRNSQVQRAGGRIVVQVYEGNDPLMKGELEGECVFQPEVKFSGSATLTLERRLEWPRPGSGVEAPAGYSFFLDKDSKIFGTVTDNKMDQAGVELLFGVAKDDDDLATGKLNGIWNFQTSKFDLNGDVKLVRNWYINDTPAAENESDMSRWRLGIAEGSNLSLSILQNQFQQAQINVGLVFERGQEVVAKGGLTATYRPGDEAAFTAEANVELVKDVYLTTAGGFEVFLGTGTSAAGQITNAYLTQAQVNIILLGKQRGKPKIGLRFAAEWAGGSNFNGLAQIQVLDPIQLGPPVTLGGKTYSTFLSTSTGGQLEIINNELGLTQGNLTLDVAQDGERFARGTLEAAYDFRNPGTGINAQGEVVIFKSVNLGRAAGYGFALEGGSGLTVRIENSALSWIQGNLGLGVSRDDVGRFAEFNINGKYTGGDAPKFDGVAEAKLLKEFDLGFSALGYGFHLQPSEFSITLQDSAFTRFDGHIGLIARQRTRGRGGMQGDVKMELNGSGVKQGDGWNFNGSATAEVTGNINVGTAGVYAFSIQGGTGLSLTVANNRFTQIEGTLKGKVTENRVDFLGFDCWVRYDAGENEGDPGYVDARGSCKLLCEKELYRSDSYKFSVLPTAGPTAIIDVQRNEVKKVGGELAFRLENTAVQGNPLRIRGTARGEYDNDTKIFSGEGDIRLESDLEFNLTADGLTKIVLKAGSGGNTRIENNELRELGGTLKGELWTEKDGVSAPLVGLNAAGKYNAVTNKLERFEGNAKLLRDLTMGPSANPYLIVHQGLGANILIIDNKLITLEATNGRLTVPALNLQGGFTSLKYSCASGRDEYSGAGWIQVDMLRDQANKGRYLRGKINFEYRPDDTWDADGTVDFKVNHYIGGQVRAHINQELDPKLGGTLNIGPANVMEGRELFKKKIKLFSMSMRFAAGPVPISLNVGAEGSLGVDMLPLRMSGSVGFDDFYPKRMNAPSFQAQANMDWGLRVKAALMAYADARVDVAVASLGLGVLGTAEVGGDAIVNGGVTLNSDGSKFWGELGLGLKFAPTASVAVKPYVVAGLLGQDFKHEFKGLSFDLGNVFSWEYGKTYKFGDQPEAPAANGERPPVQTGGVKSDTSKATSAADAQALSTESMPAAPSAKAGEPQMESGAQMAGEKKDQAKKSSGNPELDEKMALIGEIGEVAGAVADIVSQVMTLIGAAMLGPIAFVLVICWKWVTGDLKKLVNNVMKVIDFWGKWKHLLIPYLPDWWNGFIEFAQNPSSAIDKWWNADVYTRKAVAQGEHVGTPPEVRGKMVETLFSGIAQEGDRRAMEVIFEYSVGRGDLRKVIKESGSDGDDFADSWWWHGDWNGSKLKRLWDQNGIEYS